MLGELNFTTNLSPKADRFLTALIGFMGNRVDPITLAAVNQVARTAELNSEELENVLVELDGVKIDRHDGGMISLRPEEF